MEVDPEPSSSSDVSPEISDIYLQNLLEMNIHDKGKDCSVGVLDYSTPDSIDPVLLPTYSALPRVQ